jgi:hypothetical protein
MSIAVLMAALVVVPAAVTWARIPSGFGTPASPPAEDPPDAAPVSARTAAGDPWSGFATSASSSLSSAEATAGGMSDEPGTGIALGLGILGVGIAGLTGAFLVR